jgi:hypothetical protein
MAPDQPGAHWARLKIVTNLFKRWNLSIVTAPGLGVVSADNFEMMTPAVLFRNDWASRPQLKISPGGGSRYTDDDIGFLEVFTKPSHHATSSLLFFFAGRRRTTDARATPDPSLSHRV